MKRNPNYKHPEHPRYAALDIAPEIKIQTDRIKIVSYNIKVARKIDAAIDLLADSVSLNNADVICLQEMDLRGVEKIANALQYNYVYYPAISHPVHGIDFGNAVLSKWPVLDDRKIILPYLSRIKWQRIAVAAQIRVNNRPVVVFSVHKEVFMNPNYRCDQIRHMIESIPANMQHVIFAGDFNTFTRKVNQTVLDEFIGNGFRVASDKVDWSYKYWYLFNRKVVLDYIFTKGFTPLNSGNVVNLEPSDHLPIWADLQF